MRSLLFCVCVIFNSFSRFIYDFVHFLNAPMTVSIELNMNGALVLCDDACFCDVIFCCLPYWRCSVVAQITSQPQLMVADPNGNHDSGYAPSNVDDVLTGIAEDSSPPDSPVASGTLQRSDISSSRRDAGDISPKREHTIRWVFYFLKALTGALVSRLHLID